VTKRRKYNGRRRYPVAAERDLAMFELVKRLQTACPGSRHRALELAYVFGWERELGCPVEAQARAQGVLLRLEKRGLVRRVYERLDRRGQGGGNVKAVYWLLCDGWESEYERLKSEQALDTDSAGL